LATAIVEVIIDEAQHTITVFFSMLSPFLVEKLYYLLRGIGGYDSRNEFLILEDAHDLLKGFYLVLGLVEH
jgi:hypothetical protein